MCESYYVRLCRREEIKKEVEEGGEAEVDMIM